MASSSGHPQICSVMSGKVFPLSESSFIIIPIVGLFAFYKQEAELENTIPSLRIPDHPSSQTVTLRKA